MGIQRPDRTHDVIAAAIEVHRELGPGLLESVYERCLAVELDCRGIPYSRQVIAPLVYKGVEVVCGLRADFRIRDDLIVELKVVRELKEIHRAQLLTYLRLFDCPIGLLINFNVLLLKSGICRVVNGK